MKDLLIRTCVHQHEALALLSGRLVNENCELVQQQLRGLIVPPLRRVFIDLAGLEYLDSAGLGALVGLKMIAQRAQAQLFLLNPSPAAAQIFRMARLDAIFEIRAGAEAADLTAMLIAESPLRSSEPSAPVAPPLKPTRSMNPVPMTDFTQPGGDGRVRQLCHAALDHIQRGDYVKAAAAYERARALEPDDLSILNNLALIYEKKQEWYQQARQVWEMVYELSQSRGDERHAARARRRLELLGKLTTAGPAPGAP